MKRKNIFVLDNAPINIFWISILLPGISVFSTLGISYLLDNIGIMLTIVILSGSILTVLIIEAIVLFIIRGTHSEKTLEVLNNATKEAFLTAFRDLDVGVLGISGIYPEEEIAQMERSNSLDDIWLISHDLLTEIENGVYSGVVSENIKKGINYIYFVPRSSINSQRIGLIKKKCNNNKNLKFYYLDDDFFFLVPQIDFAIYEPLKSFEEGKRGYMGMNIEGLSGRYETLINTSFTDALIAKLNDIKNTTKEV